MNATRTLTIFNAGGTVERNGVLVPVKEEIPPFAVIVLGEPDKQAAGFDRDGVHVWRAFKPGANASLYRPEIIAINGPVRVPYGGYGEATQAWPAPAAVDLSETADSERPGDLLKTHATLGPRNDSWCLHPGGGAFTQMGLHAGKAVSLGASVDAQDRWSNVSSPAVCMVSPSTFSLAWMTGWRELQSFSATSNASVVDPLRSVMYRMQQPHSSARDLRRLFEPIDDGIDHSPTSQELAFGISQVKRKVRWVRVSEAGTYRVSFSFSAVDVIGGPDQVIEIGVFAAWPERNGYNCIPHPAIVANKTPILIVIEGQDIYNNDLSISSSLRGSDTISASGIMELDEDWAFGFVPIYHEGESDDWTIQKFQCLVERIGPPSDVSRFWESIASKVTYSNGWAGFTDTAEEASETINTYPVSDPETLIATFTRDFLKPD